jgi:raffinose/stachyose/melibiose transport system substrate-binding protein
MTSESDCAVSGTAPATRTHSWRRRIVRRGLAATAVGLVLASVLAACGTKSSSSGGTVTLHVQTLTGPQAQDMQVMAQAYEASHPNVKIQIDALADVASKMPNVAVLNGSNPPDVGFVQYDGGAYAAELANNKLTPLTDIWQSNNLAKHYGPSVTKQYTVNGSQYAVLWDTVYIAPMYYNVDAFAKAGITVTNHRITLPQFYDAVSKLKANGYQGLGVGGNTSYHLGHLVDMLLQTAATPAQYDSLLTNWQSSVPATVKYTDPAFVNTLQTLKDFQSNGVFQSGMLSQDYTQAEALFAAGKLGMFMGGTWTPSELNGSLKVPFKYDYILPPTLNPAQTTKFEGVATDAFVLPLKSKHPTQAKDFLKFVGSAQGQTAVAKGGLLPIFADLPASDLTTIGPVVSSILQDVKTNGSAGLWDSLVPNTIGQPFGVPKYQALLSGQSSVQQVASEFQTELDKLRAG